MHADERRRVKKARLRKLKDELIEVSQRSGCSVGF